MTNTTPFTTPGGPPQFSAPSQGDQQNDEELARRGELFDGLGRRKIIHPDHIGKENPKLVGYTRATTFISALEDTSALEKWRKRLTLEGIAMHNLGEVIKAAQRQKAAAERNDPEGALKAYRAELDEIADFAFCEAGGRDSANYGTALHALVEDYHNGGDEVDQELLDSVNEEWPGIDADFLGYIDAWGRFKEATGARVMLCEALVVNDTLKVAGRTDLVVLAKLPGDSRARRVMLDLKTGKVDNGLKLSQQLAMYTGSKLYDPETGIRSPLRVRQDVAIVAHAPRGEGKTTLITVQLQPGRSANILSLKVRQSRRKIPGITQEFTL